jgi:hypothetical protein
VLVDQTTSRVVHLSNFRVRDKELYAVWRCVLFLTFLPPPIPGVSFASPETRLSCNIVASLSIQPNKRQQRRLSISSLRQQSYMIPTISQLQSMQMLKRNRFVAVFATPITWSPSRFNSSAVATDAKYASTQTIRSDPTQGETKDLITTVPWLIVLVEVRLLLLWGLDQL